MKQILYILFTVALMQSCSSGDVYPKPTPPDEPTNKSKSYITTFISEPAFEAGYNQTGFFGIYTPYLNKENIVDSGPLFDQLCEKYGDVSYNRPSESAPVYADEFTYMDIVSDQDFDAEHPAGTSLADIVMVHASSPYKFIKSGYKDSFDWRTVPKGCYPDFLGVEPGFHLIYKLLSEMTPEDMILLQYHIRFTFTKPRPEGKQTYTITLKTKDKTYENKVTIE